MLGDIGFYLSGQSAGNCVLYPFPIVGMHQFRIAFKGSIELAGVKAEDLLDLARPFHFVGRDSPLPSSHLRGLQRQPRVLFAGAQSLFCLAALG